MAFGQSGIELQRALAVEFGLLQPAPAGVDFEMAFRAYQGENGMGERKGGIASHRIHQGLGSFLQEFWVPGGTAPVTLMNSA